MNIGRMQSRRAACPWTEEQPLPLAGLTHVAAPGAQGGAILLFVLDFEGLLVV